MFIDLSILTLYKISFARYFILYCVSEKKFDDFERYASKCERIKSEDFQFLERYGFITCKEKEDYAINNIQLTKKGRSLILSEAAKMLVKQDSEELDWIEEWRDLFPKGVYSGSFPIRANVNDINKKMIKFLKHHDYDKDTIFAATKKYINEKEMNNYAYVQRSIYFIEKNGSSTLADYCEMIKNGDEDRDLTKTMKMA